MCQGRTTGLDQRFSIGVICLTLSFETIICLQIFWNIKTVGVRVPLASSRERAPILPTLQGQYWQHYNAQHSSPHSQSPKVWARGCFPEGLWFLLAWLALPAPGYPGRTRPLNAQIEGWTQSTLLGWLQAQEGSPASQLPFSVLLTPDLKYYTNCSCL